MKKRTVKILTVIAIVIVVLGVVYAIMVCISSVKLNRAYADLRKDSRPTQQWQVIPPKVPDTENAALLYECAIKLLKAQPSPEKDLPYYLGDLSKTFIEESLDADKLTELKQLIGQDVITLALSIVEQGTQRESCRFNLDYDDGLYTLLPHIPDLRNLARIFCAKIYLEAENGNSDTAWEMFQTYLKFADALRTEPIIISQLVRIAMVKLSCDTIMKLCEIAPPSTQQATDIQSLLKDFVDIRPLVISIDAERMLIGEWFFNLPKREILTQEQGDFFSDDWPDHIFQILRIYFKPTLLTDRELYLRFMHEAARFIENPSSRKQLDVLEEEIEKKRHSITSMLIVSIIRIKQIHREMIVKLSIAQTGLALLQYKQANNAFPATLEALKLPNINDPYTDGPLIYKNEGEDFILYSVGPDKKDNNGIPRQGKQEEDWDIVWHFSNKR
jgi:hypothetical protein